MFGVGFSDVYSKNPVWVSFFKLIGWALLIISLSLSSAHGQFPNLYEVYEVTANRLRMRAEPNLESEVLGLLKRGTPVLIVKRRGDWARINVNAEPSFGWVRTDYLKGPEE